MIITFIHFLILSLPSLFLLCKGNIKYYDLIIAIFTFTAVHWLFFKNECIISYFYKKITKCSYKLGDNIEHSDINKFTVLHFILSIFTMLSIFYMSNKLNYNVILLICILIFKLLNNNNAITHILIFITSLFYLKNNKYFIPGLILTSASSLIVKYKDKNSCIKFL